MAGKRLTPTIIINASTLFASLMHPCVRFWVRTLTLFRGTRVPIVGLVQLKRGPMGIAQKHSWPVAGMQVALVAVWLLVGGLRGVAAPLQFNRDIRPILAENCVACHGPDRAQRKGGLRLDERAAALGPAKSGRAAIVPGRPVESELYKRIGSKDPEEVMPPRDSGRTLSAAQKETLRRWLAEGASYESHWAFLPVRRPELPAVKLKRWPRNPIDRFVLARLESAGLSPSPEADRIGLIRRLSLDLTGLPPTLAEVDAFLADGSAEAYERVVDRLLASPHYGERMAVDWLDAARFADSNGYQVDRDREAYAWRDWVIRAFNTNQPFDRFTIEQIAGDLLPQATFDQRIATGLHRNHMVNEEGGIIPEEFLAEYCSDRVETTATVWLGQTFNCARCHDHKYDPFTQRDYYGLYAFFHNVTEKGIGNYGVNIRRNNPPMVQLPAPELEAKRAALKRAEAEAGAELDRVVRALVDGQEEWERRVREAPIRWAREAALAFEFTGLPSDERVTEAVRVLLSKEPAQRSAEEKKQLVEFRQSRSEAHAALSARRAKLAREIDEVDLQIPTALVMEELPMPRPTHVLMRGAYDRKGELVTPSTPASLPRMASGWPTNRLGLAYWLTDRTNPLPARVTVNRFWQTIFGAGLVRTAEDFGVQGEPPSHPELLDWLASEFVDSGWDVKRMMRLLVTSATYRQSSKLSARLRERDPQNRLYARGPRFRLSAEVIRDQALAASGLLVPRIGGPSVRPYHPPGLYEQVVSGSSADTYVMGKGEDLHRRSLYTYWKRSVPNPAMLLFDAPFREACAVRRPRTNTPLQALNVMNDPTFVEAARHLAMRALREGGSTPAGRLSHAFRLLTGRPLRKSELAVLSAAVAREQRRFAANVGAATELLKVGAKPADPTLDPAELAAYTVVASTMLNLDEVLNKE